MRSVSLPLVPDLPASARADVRYRCGYGCVRCGVTVYEYRSLSVERGTADPDDVVLLCPPCHQLFATEKLTLTQIRGFSDNPLGRQKNLSRDHMPFATGVPELIMGGAKPVRETPIPISIGGEPLLMFAPPRQGVGATRISVQLGDADGKIVRILDGNEWLAPVGDWQFRWLGERYTITALAGGSRLVLRFISRQQIAVEHLFTKVGSRTIEITDKSVEIDGMRRIDAIPSNQITGLTL